MGLFKKITQLGFRKKSRKDEKHDAKKEVLRRCHFEVMEQRRVLSADPVIAGITYLEGDEGQDTTPDYFEVTFTGGSDSTQLTQFTINGDQDLSGNLSDGDMFFDVGAEQPGTGGHHEFQFDSRSTGITESDILGVSVSDDGLQLVVNVKNFEAGDKLVFSIDVDEVERFRTDKIASGVEFEGSLFDTTFVDQNYDFTNKSVTHTQPLEGGFNQPQESGIFYDTYDGLLLRGENVGNGVLDLTRDNATGEGDRTAGTIDAYDLVAKPVTISGNVYHDENINCVHDGNEEGISAVKINLQLLNESSGQYETVASTETDASGHYEFGLDLNLQPGNYRLVEAQPDGYLDVGASAGSIDGFKVGRVASDADGFQNIISDINIPLGGTSATDYDFKEVRPASLQGNVWHDENNDAVFDSGEQGIANVLIQVNRVGAKDGSVADPFAGFNSIFVRTDANGHYEVDALPPGIYEVIEISNDPAGGNPLATFLDGKDSVGNVGGTTVGTQLNDRFNTIELCADDKGAEYNFGEIKPASIGGFVSVSTPEGDCLDPTDPNHVGIAGVEVQLYGENGKLVASTQTDADGHYEFDSLMPGVYTVVEVQPDGYLDGAERIGEVDGNISGIRATNDTLAGIVLSSGSEGTNYNFCEHVPAELSGTVWHDQNNDGVRDANEDTIGNVKIQLFDAQGDLVAETVTDSNGRYAFKNLMPGTYKVNEIQPDTFVDGKDSLGSIKGLRVGDVANDMFSSITLAGGDKGVNYDFGEIRNGSISGRVHGDANGDCDFEASEGDLPLENVTVILLDANNQEVARTLTDANGEYAFNDLEPGTYAVREVTPDGYIDGSEHAGSVGGRVTNDRIADIKISSGQAATNYDFCEHIPAEIHGTVYHDANNDGVQNNGEQGIGKTIVKLFDGDGNVVAETETMDNGEYWFTGLIPGTYSVQEIQPGGYVDGIDSLGSNGGTKTNDKFVDVTLKGGDKAVNYDFGEILLSEISGRVHADGNGDCTFDANDGDRPLSGVTLQLLDQNGNVIAMTTTDDAGNYKFTDLLPGEYSIREVQPDGFFSLGEHEGDGGGTATENLISGISVFSGQKLTQYDFCEEAPAEIRGRVWEDGPAFQNEEGVLPANYRQQRDGIYQEGTDRALAGVRMQLYYYLDPANGDIAPRAVTLGEVMSEHYTHMGTSDPNAEVWIDTSATGEYSFRGLKAGSYIVLETQPEGLADSNDTPGSTTGFTYNSSASTANAQSAVIRVFSTEQIMDSVVNIQVNAGGISVANNFSEVSVIDDPTDPYTPPGGENPPGGNPLTPRPGLTGMPGLFGAQAGNFTQIVGSSRGAQFQVSASGEQYTWHLSVINGGLPRAVGEATLEGSPWLQASFMADSDWNQFDMAEATWTFSDSVTSEGQVIGSDRLSHSFGMLGGKALAGDFDGDGVDEVAVYMDGYWMIDINRNGRWDAEDLMARLGDLDDQAVVGDWDGDGKDDIGIYGPIWERDFEAIEHDPGLPNPENQLASKPKNIPPTTEDSTTGARIMRLSAYGQQRADVIDHVFGVDDHEKIAITGDWNGNGIRSIGTFEDGSWRLDVNGDGQFNYEDVYTQFGKAGDRPVVGDFDGDGVEQIAIYRSGTWIVDSNQNHQLDATDMTFEYGGANDQPVAGDWDGDGTDEPALYGQDQGWVNNQIDTQ